MEKLFLERLLLRTAIFICLWKQNGTYSPHIHCILYLTSTYMVKYLSLIFLLNEMFSDLLFISVE